MKLSALVLVITVGMVLNQSLSAADSMQFAGTATAGDGSEIAKSWDVFEKEYNKQLKAIIGPSMESKSFEAGWIARFKRQASKPQAQRRAKDEIEQENEIQTQGICAQAGEEIVTIQYSFNSNESWLSLHKVDKITADADASPEPAPFQLATPNWIKLTLAKTSFPLTPRQEGEIKNLFQVNADVVVLLKAAQKAPSDAVALMKLYDAVVKASKNSNPIPPAWQAKLTRDQLVAVDPTIVLTEKSKKLQELFKDINYSSSMNSGNYKLTFGQIALKNLYAGLELEDPWASKLPAPRIAAPLADKKVAGTIEAKSLDALYDQVAHLAGATYDKATNEVK